MKTYMILVAALLFAIGLLIGRAYPAHHYEHIGGTLLMDTTTGKVCTISAYDAAKPAEATGKSDVFDVLAAQVQAGKFPLCPR